MPAQGSDCGWPWVPSASLIRKRSHIRPGAGSVQLQRSGTGRPGATGTLVERRLGARRRYSPEVASSEGVRLGEQAARQLVQTGRHEIGPGLTDAEFTRIERDYEFEFADDHRAFLAAGLPLKTPEPYERRNPWPDWRDGDPGDLREILGWPVEGTLFDVQYDAFWHPSWGQRPARMSKALSTARRHLAQAPKMIPVWGHRYLPAGRGTYGHPVLSIYQTDVIMFGTDLAEYIAIEFQRRSMIPDLTPPPDWIPPPMVPFWSDFLTGELGWS